jgi:hypothetical protein
MELTFWIPLVSAFGLHFFTFSSHESFSNLPDIQSGKASNIREKIPKFRNNWWEHVEGMKENFNPKRGLNLVDDL